MVTAVTPVAPGSSAAEPAAGPAAAIRGAATLLVRGGGVPGPSATELERLNPRRVIVLGGPLVISQSVFDAMAAYADG